MARRRGEESADLIDADALADLVPGLGTRTSFATFRLINFSAHALRISIR
jgi:hypothetical protein